MKPVTIPRLLAGLPVVLLVVLSSQIAPAFAEPSLFITSPPVGEPVMGRVLLAAEVESDEGIYLVEFFVDGEKVGERDEPPWEVELELGFVPRSRRIEVVAIDHLGEEARGVLVTPGIPVEESIEVDLQQLYVTVERDGERLLGLESEDFAVIDEGERQRITTFARGDVRLTAVVLVDASTSMLGRRLLFALRGAAAFVEGISPQDAVSIQLFSDRLLHRTPLTNNPYQALEGLAEVRAEGGTALYDHLYRALQQLEEEQGRRVVILLSDGVDSHSVLRAPEVRWLARRSQALIYWLRSDRPRAALSSARKSAVEYREDYRTLEHTVSESGGRVITLETIDETERVLRGVLRELREQYVLGYDPESRRRDGSWRRVTVRVDRPGVRVRVREGYWDD